MTRLIELLLILSNEEGRGGGAYTSIYEPVQDLPGVSLSSSLPQAGITGDVLYPENLLLIAVSILQK